MEATENVPAARVGLLMVVGSWPVVGALAAIPTPVTVSLLLISIVLILNLIGAVYIHMSLTRLKRRGDFNVFVCALYCVLLTFLGVIAFRFMSLDLSPSSTSYFRAGIEDIQSWVFGLGLFALSLTHANNESFCDSTSSKLDDSIEFYHRRVTTSVGWGSVALVCYYDLIDLGPVFLLHSLAIGSLVALCGLIALALSRRSPALMRLV